MQIEYDNDVWIRYSRCYVLLLLVTALLTPCAFAVCGSISRQESGMPKREFMQLCNYCAI